MSTSLTSATRGNLPRSIAPATRHPMLRTSLVCLGSAVALAVTSILLAMRGGDLDHLGHFNLLAKSMFALGLLSLGLSFVGCCLARWKSVPLLLVNVSGLVFLCWLLLNP